MKKVLVPGPLKDKYECASSCVRALEKSGVSAFASFEADDVSQCDGVMIPGGFPDVSPALYGEKNTASKSVDVEFDWKQIRILEAAIAQQKPVFGICRGYQLLNVYFGGSLIQDLKYNDIHEHSEAEERVHDSICLPQTFIHQIYGEHAIVNTKHHQAIKDVAADFEVSQLWLSDSAKSCEKCSDSLKGSDNCIIEAIHHRTLPIFGVQWHPEMMLMNPIPDTSDPALIFSYFISML